MMTLRPYRLITAAFLAAATLVVSSPATAQEFATPGPEHKRLQELEGTWDAVIKTAEGGESSKGVAVYKIECGGLWLVSDFNGSFGDVKFQGRGLDGYDTNKKKYVGIWVDSMTTSVMTFEGTYDEKSKVMTMEGEGPGMDGKPAKYKTTSSMADKNKHTFKMFTLGPDGKENLMMTIEYTRRKA